MALDETGPLQICPFLGDLQLSQVCMAAGLLCDLAEMRILMASLYRRALEQFKRILYYNILYSTESILKSTHTRIFKDVMKPQTSTSLLDHQMLPVRVKKGYEQPTPPPVPPPSCSHFALELDVAPLPWPRTSEVPAIEKLAVSWSRRVRSEAKRRVGAGQIGHGSTAEAQVAQESSLAWAFLGCWQMTERGSRGAVIPYHSHLQTHAVGGSETEESVRRQRERERARKMDRQV